MDLIVGDSPGEIFEMFSILVNTTKVTKSIVKRPMPPMLTNRSALKYRPYRSSCRATGRVVIPRRRISADPPATAAGTSMIEATKAPFTAQSSSTVDKISRVM